MTLGEMQARWFRTLRVLLIAGWSSPVARQAHNLKAAGSNPAPATPSLSEGNEARYQFFSGLLNKAPNFTSILPVNDCSVILFERFPALARLASFARTRFRRLCRDASRAWFRPMVS